MIGLIGYGRFGRLTLQYLASDADVMVFTRDRSKHEAIRRAGGRWQPLEEVCRQKAIILSVPISAMEATLQQIAPLLSPGTLVVDVCSVKVLPVRWMRRHLPDHVDILATHPMFGPDSAKDSLAGHKLVICPERIATSRLSPIVTWMERQKLEVIQTTPEEHDQKIAVSLAMTHFIGRSLSAFGAQPLDIDTEGYKRLLHILGVVQNDTWQLFEDMHHYNPYAREKRKAFIKAMQDIDRNLEAGDADR